GPDARFQALHDVHARFSPALDLDHYHCRGGAGVHRLGHYAPHCGLLRPVAETQVANPNGELKSWLIPTITRTTRVITSINSAQSPSPGPMPGSVLSCTWG